MAHRPRSEMIAETRAKLLAAGRGAFGTTGYAEASMDDFTAKVGLTRGALYHHFGDKRGLFEAVAMQIDHEMAQRLAAIAAAQPTAWEAFVAEMVGYVEMALEPEIQRILFCDGPAVLGSPADWPNANACLAATMASLQRVDDEGGLAEIDIEGTARLLVGATTAAGLWIATAEDPEAASRQAVASLRTLLDGLRATGA